MSRILFPLLAAVLLLGDGLVYGLWSNRWQSTNHLPAAVASLQRVPLEIDQWKGQALPPLKQRVVDQAGFSGYVQRRYDNPQTGATVSMLLACGPFGPLSVHTPDVCFPGHGLDQQAGITPHSEPYGSSTMTAQCWKTKFGKASTSLTTGNMQVFWAWNEGKGWQAPSYPRMTFAGAPVLYKLYLSCEIRGDDDKEAQKTCTEFMHVLFPELEKALVLKP